MAQGDPLPSWNEGASKQAILDFVAAVTEEGGDQFVPEADRIATFDNDGTLWTEQPMYAQAFFILDQVKTLAPQHPEWQTEQPYAAVLAGDREAMAKFTEADLGKLVTAAHSRDDHHGVRRAGASLGGDGGQPAHEASLHRVDLPAATGAAWTTCGPTASGSSSSLAVAST